MVPGRRPEKSNNGFLEALDALDALDGLLILVSLIRTFIAHGGSGIQFYIFDASVLRNAQVPPEKYPNLQVRVCGWNVRFPDLTPEAQDTFIRQAETIA